MMRRGDDRDGMQWLGGEAHVRATDGRPGRANFLRWLSSEALPLAAGTVLGGFVAVSAIRLEGRKQQRRIGQLVARVSNERSAHMEPVREDERRMRSDESITIGPTTVLAAFGLGLLAGAVVTLLTTPESGASVRTRLKRGAEAATRELGEIAGETKESWDRVRDDTEDAVKRTATRIKEAARVTKEALVEDGNSVPKVP